MPLPPSAAEVDRVGVYQCGRDGIVADGAGPRVTNSTAVQNGGQGIVLGNGGTAEANESRGNASHALLSTGPRLVGRIVANRFHDNGGFGITSIAAFQPVASRNFLASNGLGPYSLVVSLGDNLCLNGFC